MPLLCGLGRHKIDRLARWNDGYYFAKCRRCGHDLVRTAYEGWSIPQGFRVVWQAEPPRHARFAQVVHDDEQADEPAEASSAGIEFPIRDAKQDVDGDANGSAPFDAERVVEDEPRAEAMSGAQDELQEAGASLVVASEAFPPLDEPPVHDEELYAEAHDDEDEAAGQRDEAPAEPFMFNADRAASETSASELGLSQASEPAAAEGSAPALEPPEDLATEAPVPLAEPERRPNYIIPDFMNENPAEIDYDRNTGEIKTKPRPRGDESGGRRGFFSAGWRDLIRKGAEPAAPSRPSASAAVAAAPVGPPRARSFLGEHKELAAAALFGGLVLAAALVDGSGDPVAELDRPASTMTGTAAPAAAPAANQTSVPAGVRDVSRAAPKTAQASDRAYVTANLLNCRAIPADDGATVRRLARGAPVQVLGADPGWVSVSHQGQQCWASARFISTQRPL